jgi:hypothetical protein
VNGKRADCARRIGTFVVPGNRNNACAIGHPSGRIRRGAGGTLTGPCIIPSCLLVVQPSGLVAIAAGVARGGVLGRAGPGVGPVIVGCDLRERPYRRVADGAGFGKLAACPTV